MVGLSVYSVKHRSEDGRGMIYRIGTHEFHAEIADTEEGRGRGLGYRSSLCTDCGMLFVFPQSDRYGFWMKGMEFPLDILWVRDSRVVFIEKGIAVDDQRTLIPPVSADQVFEMNAGLVDRYGIAIGDRAEFTRH